MRALARMVRALPTSEGTVSTLAAGATAAAGLVALGGCGTDVAPASSVQVRDSAGITIVENAGAGAWAEGSAWRVSAEPVVDIGVLEGSPEYQLFEVAGSARLSDGRIVVANAGTHELRFYDGRGRHIRSVGREGGGPGEFERLRDAARLPGDSVLAWDGAAGRFSVFDSAGDFIRSARAEDIGGFAPHFHGAFEDGSGVLTQGFQPVFDGSTEIGRDSVAYLRFGRDGALLDTLGPFPGDEQILMSGGSPGDQWLSRRDLPFGRETYVAVHGRRFYVADSNRYEIRVYAAADSLVRIVRRDHEPRPVTADDIRAFEEDYRGRIADREDENARRREARILAEMPFPETFPAFSDLRVDAGGHLWVDGYRAPGEERPRWDVFDPDGRLLGTVETPVGLEILQIGADYLLGLWHDALDVEHIRLYELVKPPAAAASGLPAAEARPLAARASARPFGAPARPAGGRP